MVVRRETLVVYIKQGSSEGELGQVASSVVCSGSVAGWSAEMPAVSYKLSLPC